MDIAETNHLAEMSVAQAPNEMIIVSQIEKDNYHHFQQAAFKAYQQAVTTYGRRVQSEARSVAYHRDPDADRIEITTPDIEVATIRVEMKLARLRQLRFPFMQRFPGQAIIARKHNDEYEFEKFRGLE